MLSFRQQAGFRQGLLFAQSNQFADRLLDQLAILERQLARQCQAVRPVFAVGRVSDVRQAHPGRQNATAIRTFGGLGGVEIEAGIQFLEAIMLQFQFIHPEIIGDDIAGLKNVVVAVAFRLDSLRRKQQHCFAVDLEQVRTFPHVAEVRQAGVDFAHQFPFQGILGAIHQDRAGFVATLGTDDGVIDAVLLPDFGIADVVGVAFRIAGDSRRQKLREAAVRFQAGNDLVRHPFPFFRADIAGVHDVQLAVLDEAAARIDAVAVVRGVRKQRDALFIPLHEVRRSQMEPVFQAVDCAHRKPLIEKMPFAVEISEAVRIVQKACVRLDVVVLAEGGLRHPFRQFVQIVVGIIRDLFIALLARPFFHRVIPFFVCLIKQFS